MKAVHTLRTVMSTRTLNYIQWVDSQTLMKKMTLRTMLDLELKCLLSSRMEVCGDVSHDFFWVKANYFRKVVKTKMQFRTFLSSLLQWSCGKCKELSL